MTTMNRPVDPTGPSSRPRHLDPAPRHPGRGVRPVLGRQRANPTQNASATEVALTVTSNAISGGKNAAEADWYANYVIPKFTEAQKAKGVNVTVKFQPSGVDDEQYKAKMALDLKSKSGADVIALDGIWVGEFAEAGYIKPLADVVGANVTSWDGWAQIPKAVQANASYNDKLYGVPGGTDGRVLYYNKKLFQQAGLPADWQPTSWQEILDAGAKLKAVSGVTPIQINAGTAMGEATTMQGALEPAGRHRRGDLPGRQVAGQHPEHPRRPRLLQAAARPGPDGQELPAGRQGPRRVVRRVRRQQDRHPARGRLLLALGHQPGQGLRADGHP